MLGAVLSAMLLDGRACKQLLQPVAAAARRGQSWFPATMPMTAIRTAMPNVT